MGSRILATLAAALLAGSAGAQSIVEGFTEGSNHGAWTFGSYDQQPSFGGNPDYCLRHNWLTTTAPQPRTGRSVSSAFTGDYRARGVTSTGVDVKTWIAQPDHVRYVTLILENDAGTPGTTSDDTHVYFVSPVRVPQPGAAWAIVDVAVPSASTSLPAGWRVLLGSGTDDQAWNAVITNVSGVVWSYGDPTSLLFSDTWHVGIDNPRIANSIGTPFCSGDGSGTPCPCGNVSTTPRGCLNSTGVGALLGAFGGSLATADLTLRASSMPHSTTSLLMRSTSQQNGGAGVVFGDGLRCLANPITRMGARPVASGSATWGPGLALGSVPAGPMHFQVWYRNTVGLCGGAWNLTNGHTVVLSP